MCDNKTTNILSLTNTSTIKLCKPYESAKTLSSCTYEYNQCCGTSCAAQRILITLSTPKSLCEFKIDQDNDPTTKIIKLDKMDHHHITSMSQYGKSIIGISNYGFNIYMCDQHNVTTQIFARDNSNLECSVIELLSKKNISTHKINIVGIYMRAHILFFIVFQSHDTSRNMYIMSVPICYCDDTPKYDQSKIAIHGSYDIYKLSMCNNICNKYAKNMTVMNVTVGPRNELYILSSYGKGGYIWKIEYFLNLSSYSVIMKCVTQKINCSPRTITYINNKFIVLTNPNKCGDDVTMYTFM
jgi:hypothetical protein